MHYVVSPDFSRPVEVDDKPINLKKVLNAKVEQVVERILSFRLS